MRAQKCFISLLIDSFSGHSIAYKPQNIRLEFFRPNLTSHVQPLDAGIIRCVKAHYRRAVCKRAIDKDEAGESDLYTIDLLEAMMILREAWNEITSSTIQHCWKHAGLQP